MTDVDFDNKPFVAPKDAKTFGTVDTSVDFLEALGADQALKRNLSALQRGPIRFCRNNVIVAEGDVTDYIFFVIKGVIRSCKTFENGARSIVAFYMPGDVFGWSDLTYSLSIEAATDTELLFVKRSAFLSIASREVRVANFLLTAPIVGVNVRFRR